MFSVLIQEADFDISALQRSLLDEHALLGAIATFTGYVRADKGEGEVQSLQLEHYPGMTEKSIEEILNLARERWPLLAAKVVHRVGCLYSGEQIVWVGVSSSHREAAFSACEFIMDYLKTRAPLWKKEVGPQGERWVEAKETDRQRNKRWIVEVSK